MHKRTFTEKEICILTPKIARGNFTWVYELQTKKENSFACIKCLQNQIGQRKIPAKHESASNQKQENRKCSGISDFQSFFFITETKNFQKKSMSMPQI